MLTCVWTADVHLIERHKSCCEQLIDGLPCLSEHLQHLHQQIVDSHLPCHMVSDLSYDRDDHFLSDVDAGLREHLTHRVTESRRAYTS
jgi:hypothetical protein